MLFSFAAIAQKNIIYEAAKKHTIKWENTNIN